MRTCCPSCSSEVFVKNGFSRRGDQNHRCLECGRQFVLDPQNKIISDETRDMVRKLLLEKLSLQGICRVTNVSQKWLLDFIKQEYARTPKNPNVQVPPDSLGLILERLEADELWSFVGKKKNQVWIWLALDALTRQAMAIHAGRAIRTRCESFLGGSARTVPIWMRCLYR